MATHKSTLDPYGVLGKTLSTQVSPDSNGLEFLLLQMGGHSIPPSDGVSGNVVNSKRGAQPGDVCPDCGVDLLVQGMAYECPQCSRMFEAADLEDVISVSTPERPGAKASRGRLRVVGKDSRYYQPDLDRTSPGDSSEVQKKSTYQELLRYNNEYSERGGNPFPKDVLKSVAEEYNVVQKQCVKRSQMKKQILAALVYHICLTKGFSRSKSEAAQLMKLVTNGISKGSVFLRSVGEDSEMEINMNCDRRGPHINSTFAQLDMVEGVKCYRDAVDALVRRAEEAHIGTRSILRSKIIAATFEVLRRAKVKITIDEMSTKCKIRKHTIHRFLKELDAFHSHFAETYKEHKLYAEKWQK
jgi:hypothetical protein